MGNTHSTKEDSTAYSFSSAIFPSDFIVLGIKLRPFSLGSLIILEKYSSPIVSSNEVDLNLVDGIYNFLFGLVICGQTYEQNLLMLENIELLNNTMKQVTDNMLINMDLEKGWNIFDKMNIFKNYIDYHMDIPIFTEQNENKELPSGTDWKTNIFITFKKMGYTETEILNMNFKKLFYEWCSWAESEGGIKVWNKYEVQQYQNLG